MTLLIACLLIYWGQMPVWFYALAAWVWVTKHFLIGWSRWGRLDD